MSLLALLPANRSEAAARRHAVDAARHVKVAHRRAGHRHGRRRHHHHRHRRHRAVRRPLILIDAGHGGRDGGAVGRGGVEEKNVALAEARDLRRVLIGTGRYRVAMTRTGDTTVSLGRRLRMVRRSGAALLISLHADSSRNHKARGASVIVRSDGEEALAVASLGEMPDHAGERVRATEVQAAMINRLDDDIRMSPAPVRAAHLYVLASKKVPGVLVELGFLSNRADERLLRNRHHLLVIARAIRDAVDGYFRDVRKAGKPGA